MKKSLSLLVVLCVLFLSMAMSRSKGTRVDERLFNGFALLIPMHTYIPVYNNPKKECQIDSVINDTIQENYVSITIYRIKDGMAEISVTYLLDSILGIFFFFFEGWMETKFLGTNLASYSDSIVKAYASPNRSSDVVFEIVYPHWGDWYPVKDASKGWLYIQNIYNASQCGWVAPEDQCNNPYTTCC